MSARERSKGRRGQAALANLLRGRDWRVHELNGGMAVADFVATDDAGRTWCVECKNCASILPAHMRQARQQARASRLPWMLAHHLPGTTSWLVQRQGERPTVWHEGVPE